MFAQKSKEQNDPFVLWLNKESKSTQESTQWPSHSLFVFQFQTHTDILVQRNFSPLRDHICTWETLRPAKLQQWYLGWLRRCQWCDGWCAQQEALKLGSLKWWCAICWDPVPNCNGTEMVGRIWRYCLILLVMCHLAADLTHVFWIACLFWNPSQATFAVL